MKVVLVHGNPETAAVWGPLIAALGGHGIDDVVTLNPPGFGAPPPPWPATPDRYVTWLIDELAALSQPVHALGHDMGAGHLLGVVAERPELIQTWSVDTIGLLHPDYQWHDAAAVWQTPEAGEQANEFLLSLSPNELTDAYISLGIERSVAAKIAAAYDEHMARCVLEFYRGATRDVLEDLRCRLDEAQRPPGLVLDPTDDAYVASSLSRAVAEQLGVSVATLSGAGHWWSLSHADEAASTLADFWSANE